MRLTTEQLKAWFSDRARQELMGTSISPTVRSRGDHLRRLNSGVALRTYLSVRAERCF